jgi:DNA-directed RNA polymerase specialized sigma24 family protein
MRIARHRIVSLLRQRGQQVRADWVERELPERVNSDEHTGLFAILRLDPADLADTPSP